MALLFPNFLTTSSTILPSFNLDSILYEIKKEFNRDIPSTLKLHLRQLEEFAKDTTHPKNTTLILPPSLDAFDRRVIHSVAERMQLDHTSSGLGKTRQLILAKRKQFSINGLCVIEIFSTSKMTDKKIEFLNLHKVPWAEISASEEWNPPATLEVGKMKI